MIHNGSRFMQLRPEMRSEIAKYLERFRDRLATVASHERLQEFLAGYILAWLYTEQDWTLQTDFTNCLCPGKAVTFSKPGMRDSEGVLIALAHEVGGPRRLALIYRASDDSPHSTDPANVHCNPA